MSSFLDFFKSDEANAKDMKDKNLIVKINHCPQNHPCPSVKVCPVSALTQKGYAAPKVDKDSCIKCGKCVRFCPMRALALE